MNEGNAPISKIEDIVAMIAKPMVVIRDNNGYIHDMSSLAIKCDRDHIHRYFIKDIIDNNGILKCATCNGGSRYSRVAREIFETILQVPFVLKSNTIECIEYINLVLKIKIICIKMGGTDSYEIGAQMTIRIYQTNSVRRIKNILYRALRDYIELNEHQRASVLSICHNKLKKPKKFYQRDPLPILQERADLLVQTAINPTLARFHTNVILTPDKLCLENC